MPDYVLGKCKRPKCPENAHYFGYGYCSSTCRVVHKECKQLEDENERLRAVVEKARKAVELRRSRNIVTYGQLCDAIYQIEPALAALDAAQEQEAGDE